MDYHHKKSVFVEIFGHVGPREQENGLKLIFMKLSFLYIHLFATVYVNN